MTRAEDLRAAFVAGAHYGRTQTCGPMDFEEWLESEAWSRYPDDPQREKDKAELLEILDDICANFRLIGSTWVPRVERALEIAKKL